MQNSHLYRQVVKSCYFFFFDNYKSLLAINYISGSLVCWWPFKHVGVIDHMSIVHVDFYIKMAYFDLISFAIEISQ